MSAAAVQSSYLEPLAAAQGAPPGAVADRLDSARRAVEGRFLEAGEVLGGAVEGLGALIASLETLAAAVDAGAVAETTAELSAAAAGLMALPARRARRRDGIDRMVAAGKRLGGGIEEMRRNLAYLRAFAINIKITAGGIREAGREFGDFAQEICDCIAQGREDLEAFDRDLRALDGVFQSAWTHEDALAEQCAGLLPAVPDGLKASAAAMVAQRQRISQAAVGVTHLARNVQRKVGQALGALQIGDITRQRIEHVSEGLAMLGQVRDVTADQRERMAAYVHGLLAAQLRAASTDFHSDVGRIGSAMAGLAADAGEIQRLRELAFGGGEDGPGFLRQLEDHVGRALALVDDMARADQEAVAVGASAAAAAEGLGRRIVGLRDMKTDVQQMALNTTLKCSRIGEPGKPLAVIAIELRLHAGHMETSAADALAAVEGLSGGARMLSGDAGGEAVEGGEVADIGATLSDAAQRLRQAGDAVESDLAGLALQGEAVAGALRAAVGRLDFQGEIGAAIDAAAAAFAGRGAEALAPIDDLAEPLGDLLERLAKRYTMAQERATHQAYTAGLVFGAAVVEAAPQAADGDLDVLF